MTSISVSHCYLYRTCLSLSLRNLPALIFHHSLAYLSLATSLECCNSYSEIVSPLTFWLLIFANSQFLVNYKISSVSCASQSCGFFWESDRTIMIGWVSQEGKSVSPDQLLSREPPCFHREPPGSLFNNYFSFSSLFSRQGDSYLKSWFPPGPPVSTFLK